MESRVKGRNPFGTAKFRREGRKERPRQLRRGGEKVVNGRRTASKSRYVLPKKERKAGRFKRLSNPKRKLSAPGRPHYCA